MGKRGTDQKASQSHFRFQMWDKYLTSLNDIWDLADLKSLRAQAEDPEQGKTTDFRASLWDQHLLKLNEAWHVASTLTLDPPSSLPGKLIFPLKKILIRWIQPLLDRVIQQQNDVNARLVQTCNGIVDTVNTEAIHRLEAQQELNSRLVQTFNGLVETVDAELKRLRQELELMIWTFDRRKEALEIDEILLNQKVEQILSLLRTSPVDDSCAIPQDLPAEGRQEDYAYVVFEHRYRGDESLLKQQQREYMQYFQGGVHVLDIGCGRGEFLELLQEQNITGYGLDRNQVMVEYCRKKGLQVEKCEVISHLESLEDASLDGIFTAQVVEHYPPQKLHQLLRLCFTKLQPQKYLIIETQNPTSLYALSNFYRDMSHEKPIHPDALEFLLKTVGFQDIQVEYKAPFSQEHQLQEIDMPEDMDPGFQANIETLNKNIRQLNEMLYGHLDYAVIAKKSEMF